MTQSLVIYKMEEKSNVWGERKAQGVPDILCRDRTALRDEAGSPHRSR